MNNWGHNNCHVRTDSYEEAIESTRGLLPLPKQQSITHPDKTLSASKHEGAIKIEAMANMVRVEADLN